MGEPIELLLIDQHASGTIVARRAGEPSLTRVQGIGDAMMAALSRGVDLVIPASMIAQLRADLPPELPSWVKVVAGWSASVLERAALRATVTMSVSAPRR